MGCVLNKSFSLIPVTKPSAEHFPFPSWEGVVDLLVHGDLDGARVAHEVLGQLPAVIAKALEHEGCILHRVLKGHARSLKGSSGFSKGLPVLIADISVKAL